MSCRHYGYATHHHFGTSNGFYPTYSSSGDLYTLNASTQKLGVRLYASSAVPITHVDMLLKWVGDTSGTQFRMGIFNEASWSTPGTTRYGGYTNNFYGISGGTGTLAWCSGSGDALALSANTGSLTSGNYYWLVLEYVSGTIDSSNYVVLTSYSPLRYPTICRVARYDGSSWYSTSSDAPYYLVDADGNIDGAPVPVAGGSGAVLLPLYGTTRYAWKIQLRANITVRFVGTHAYNAVGSPTNLTYSIFEGNTYKGQVSISSLSMYRYDIKQLSSPISLSAGSYVYVVASTKGSGGNASNYFNIEAYSFGNDHIRHLYFRDSSIKFGTFTGHATDETQDTPHTSFMEEPNYKAMRVHPMDILLTDEADVSYPSGGGTGGGLPILRPSIVR